MTPTAAELPRKSRRVGNISARTISFNAGVWRPWNTMNSEPSVNMNLLHDGVIDTLVSEMRGTSVELMIRSLTNSDDACDLPRSRRRIQNRTSSAAVSGLLNKQIGAKLGISEITVKAHRGKLMQKNGGSLPRCPFDNGCNT